MFKNGYASAGNTIGLAQQVDLIIGVVLIRGAAAPKLISKKQLSELKPGAALGNPTMPFTLSLTDKGCRQV